MDNIKTRDLRTKEKFQIDDKYLNGYAKVCGWQATLVYSSLCRHASKDQYSFPSIQRMAEQHAVSRDTIIIGIKALQEYNIIRVVKVRSDRGTFKVNGYTLIDKSQWMPIQVGDIDMDIQVGDIDAVQPHNQVGDTDYKDTQYIKDTHIRVKQVSPYKSLSYLLNIPLEDIKEFINHPDLKVSEVEIRRKGRELHDYCEAKGRRYKNYKAFLRNALRREFGVRDSDTPYSSIAHLVREHRI